MNIAKDRVVSINYTIRNDKNEFLDSSGEGDFLDYLHGHGGIFPGLERALEGKQAGDRLTVSLSAAEAHGERDETLVSRIPLDRFEAAEPVKKGMRFEGRFPDGYRMVTVTGVEGNAAAVDANHPLAGMALRFDLTVAAVREARPEELLRGHTPGACSRCGEHGHGCRGCSG
jgi:FKBP-type peptidyl-prolyl cis-trans isomerase SlyD